MGRCLPQKGGPVDEVETPVAMGLSAMCVAPYRTPWGGGVVMVREGSLAGVELPDLHTKRPSTAPAVAGRPTHGSQQDRAAVARWVEGLEAYFRGERLGWTVGEVPLESLGFSPFQRKVYEVLLTVPPATTVGYGDLALLAGHPRAARAVGNVMAANPIPVVVPCHRVIKADGSMGRYGQDPSWKPLLLAHEAAHGGERS